jgi:hypothetical protein
MAHYVRDKIPFRQTPTWKRWKCFSTINMNKFHKNILHQYKTVLSPALGQHENDPAVKTAKLLECLLPTFNTKQYPHFFLFKVILLSIHGDGRSDVMKTFYRFIIFIENQPCTKKAQ